MGYCCPRTRTKLRQSFSRRTAIHYFDRRNYYSRRLFGRGFNLCSVDISSGDLTHKRKCCEEIIVGGNCYTRLIGKINEQITICCCLNRHKPTRTLEDCRYFQIGSRAKTLWQCCQRCGLSKTLCCSSGNADDNNTLLGLVVTTGRVKFRPACSKRQFMHLRRYTLSDFCVLAPRHWRLCTVKNMFSTCNKHNLLPTVGIPWKRYDNSSNIFVIHVLCIVVTTINANICDKITIILRDSLAVVHGSLCHSRPK